MKYWRNKISVLFVLLAVVFTGLYWIKYRTIKPEVSEESRLSSEESRPSVDGPQWELIQSTKVTHSVFYAGFYDASFGVTVGYHGTTYVSTDGGVTWQKSLNEANCRYGLDILDPHYFWTVGNYGGNRVSKDGGKTLNPVSDLPLFEKLPNNLVQILSSTQVVVGAPLRLARSEDGGETWSDYRLPDTKEWIMGMRFISLDEGVVLTADGFIYYTESSGKSWRHIATMPMVNGIRYDEAATVAMHLSDHDQLNIVYLDRDSQLYGYSVDIAPCMTDDQLILSHSDFNEVSIDEHDEKITRNVVPYLSSNGDLLTTVNMLGEIHLYRLKKNS